MNSANITKRNISLPEAELLIEKIKSTPNIVGYTVAEWSNCGRVIVAEDDRGQLLGACLNYDFAKNWTKIAALYVLEEYRGRGIGKALFYAAFDDAIHSGKNVYTISRNPIVIEMMNKLEFTTFDRFFNLPDRLDFYIHSLQWLASPYRIKEIIRKQIAFPARKKFIYGINLNKENS